MQFANGCEDTAKPKRDWEPERLCLPRCQQDACCRGGAALRHRRASRARLGTRGAAVPGTLADQPPNPNGGNTTMRSPARNAGFCGGRRRAEVLPPGDGSPGWMRRGGLRHPLPLPQQQHPSARSKSLLCLPCLAGLTAGRAVLAVPRCLDAHKPPSPALIWLRHGRLVEISPCLARRACGSGEGAAPCSCTWIPV